VFDVSFGELVILAVLAIVVVGPRKLPALLRSAGQLIGHLRRMATDVRKESGIDQLLEAEGINKEIDTFRRLAAGDLAPDYARERRTTPAKEQPADTASDAHGAKAGQPDPYAPTAEAAPPPQSAAPPPQPQIAPPPPPQSVPPPPPKTTRPLPGLPRPSESVKPK
jgi:sec-independent protein translocase protein TatB